VVQAEGAPARDVLVLHCGRCHRSDLDTAIPGALAVFDLTQERWDATLTSEQREGLLRRLRGIADLDPADLDSVERFVRSPR